MHLLNGKKLTGSTEGGKLFDYVSRCQHLKKDCGAYSSLANAFFSHVNLKKTVMYLHRPVCKTTVNTETCNRYLSHTLCSELFTLFHYYTV
jgi:hypothetical protein